MRMSLNDWIWDAHWLDGGHAIAVALGHNIAELYRVQPEVGGAAQHLGAGGDCTAPLHHPGLILLVPGPQPHTTGIFFRPLPTLLGQILWRDGSYGRPGQR
jgi:hypothetical protein